MFIQAVEVVHGEGGWPACGENPTLFRSFQGYPMFSAVPPLTEIALSESKHQAGKTP